MLEGLSTIRPGKSVEDVRGGLSQRGRDALDELVRRKSQLAEVALSILPGSGEVISAQESSRAASQAYEDVGQGRYGKALGGLAESVVAGLGAIPIVGEGMRLASTAMDVAGDVARQMPGLPGLGMVAFHGTPHKFAPTKRNPLGEFDLGKMGTGEGAQAYGHGIYLAEHPETARTYTMADSWKRPSDTAPYIVEGEKVFPKNIDERMIYEKIRTKVPGEIEDHVRFLKKQQQLSKNKANEYRKRAKIGGADNEPARMNRMATAQEESVKEYNELFELANNLQRKGVFGGEGHLLEVDLPDEQIAKMLDWDKPLSEQSKFVKGKLKESGINFPDKEWNTGDKIYNAFGGKTGFTNKIEQQQYASEQLRKLGIPGIKYHDAMSRSAGEGTRNFVLFDPSIAKITKRE